MMCKLKGRMDKGGRMDKEGHYDVEMKGWMKKGALLCANENEFGQMDK